MIYREPRYDTVTVYRWKNVPTKGTLSGRVTFNGQPLTDALVQIYDGKQTATDANGHYQLQDVPFGSYIVNVTATDTDGHQASSFAGVIVAQPMH